MLQRHDTSIRTFTQILLALASVCSVVAAGCAQTEPPVTDVQTDGWVASGDAGNGVCRGVDCSSHGDCVESGGKATCACDDGYHPANQTCVKNDGSDPCAGNNCNGHGTCKVVSGNKAMCECDVGYKAQGATCLAEDKDSDGAIATRDCDDQNPERAPGKQEKCDNLDNDCDGSTDENLTASCGSSIGVCRKGTKTCNNGNWSACTGGTEPSQEKCGDGLDNDCDQTADESCPCQSGQTMTCGSNTGACQTGTKKCGSNGQWGACTGQTPPKTETCNNKDDDCDGKTDEKGVCGIFRLKAGSQKWDRYSMDPKNSTYAPTSPIRAAFDIEDRDIAIVFTKTTYRVFRPSALVWEPPKAISSLTSGLSGTNIRGSWSIPAAHAGSPAGEDGIVLVSIVNGQAETWNGTFQPTKMSVSWTDEGKKLGTQKGPHTPNSIPSVRGLWLDTKNARNWVQGNPQQICGDSSTNHGTKIEPYAAAIDPKSVYFYEAGYCFEWIEEIPYANSPFGSMPAAPTSTKDIGAAFWHKGDFYLLRKK